MFDFELTYKHCVLLAQCCIQVCHNEPFYRPYAHGCVHVHSLLS